MYGDISFISRFTGDPDEVPELGVELHAEFSQLSQARAALDARILGWSQELQQDWLAQTLTYASKVDGQSRTVPRWMLVVHMFNHQTHHRGQVTTLLSQIGLDMGTTDIPFMPKFQDA